MSIKFLNKCNDSIKPNIFMQETEPEIKEGIWLQSNKTFEKISALDSYSDALQWKEANALSNEIYKNVDNMFSINNKTYFLIYNNGFKILEYDATTNSIIEEFQIEITSLYCMIANEASNELLYFDYLDGSYILKRYSLNTHTSDIISSEFSNISPTRVCLVEELLYIFSGDKKVYTFDIKKHTISNLGITNPYTYFNSGGCFYHNNNIYLMGNNNTNGTKLCYKLDLTTKSFTRLADIPYYCYEAAMRLVENKIYIFGGDSAKGNNNYKFYIYDISTNAYNEQSNLQYPVRNGYSIYTNNKILLGCKGREESHLQILEFPSSLKYDNNTIVIVNGNTYNTILLPYDRSIIEGNLLFSFLDIKYYSTEEGEIKTIPTYYGDGSKWIKFKN